VFLVRTSSAPVLSRSLHVSASKMLPTSTQRLKTGADRPLNKRSFDRAEFFALPLPPQTHLRYAPLKLAGVLADQEWQICSGNQSQIRL